MRLIGPNPDSAWKPSSIPASVSWDKGPWEARMAKKAQKGGGNQSLSEEPSPSLPAACLLPYLQIISTPRYTKAHSCHHTGYTVTYPATNTCLDKHIVTQAHIFKDSLTNSLTHTPGSWAQSVTQPPAVTLTSSARYRSDKHIDTPQSHTACALTHSHTEPEDCSQEGLCL